MEIGKYEDRVAIEAKSRIARLFVDMKKQYNPHDSITDVSVRATETKFIAGFLDGLTKALNEINELRR